MKEELTLEDLSTLSGLPIRTLRYYMQEGILQGPDSRGKYARYSPEHLDRIELIQRLKNLRLPLQEIGQIIENMTPDEITKVRQYQDILRTKIKRPDFPRTSELRFGEKKSSALEYIHNLESSWNDVKAITSAQASKPLSVPTPVTKSNYALMHESAPQPVTTKEEWTRYIIKDGIELNIRRHKGTDEESRIADLIEYAKKLFSDRSEKGSSE